MIDKDLIDLLSPTIGAAKASDVITGALRRRGVSGFFTRDQALAMLEDVAATQGIVGISARFAKVKVSLLPE
jgi:hypothetical protein